MGAFLPPEHVLLHGIPLSIAVQQAQETSRHPDFFRDSVIRAYDACTVVGTTLQHLAPLTRHENEGHITKPRAI